MRERRLLERDLGGFLGDLPIHEITAPLLLVALRKIEGRDAIETAHRARVAAPLVFRYAIATGRATGNPAADLIGALISTQTKHFATSPSPKMSQSCSTRSGAIRARRSCWPLSSCRPYRSCGPGELRHARWADINLDKAEWRYTTTKTKTPHIVPLARQSVEILRDVRPFARRGEYVFPGVRSLRSRSIDSQKK